MYIRSMVAFQIGYYGFQQNFKTCSAIYKEFVSPEYMYALIDNQLPKQNRPNGPVFRRLRYNLAAKKGLAKRLVDKPLMDDARRMIALAQPGEEEKLYAELIALFNDGNSDVASRFSNLMKNHVRAGSALAKKLGKVRRDSATNKGNTNRGKGKKATKAETESNDAATSC